MATRHNSFTSSSLIAAALVVAALAVAVGLLTLGAEPAAEGGNGRLARGGAVAEHPAPPLQSASRIARGAQTTPNAEQLAMSSAGQAVAGQPLRLPRGG